MAKVEKIVTKVNTEFIGSFKYAHDTVVGLSLVKGAKSDEDRERLVNNACKKIAIKEMTSEVFDKENGLKLISFSEYHAHKRDIDKEEKPQLIYRINQNGDDFAIMAGLYTGIVNVGKDKLEIKTQCSDLFFRRIINFCCGIYVDIDTSETSSDSSGVYSLIVQYLFLVSLRKVAGTNLPKKYVYKKDRDYSIRGNIDIERYITNDLVSSDKKISFRYPERENAQNIIDILYCAIKECSVEQAVLPDILSVRNYLAESFSGRRPSKYTVNNILKDKILKNSLYANYKKPLQYAQYILNLRELNDGNTNKSNSVSGYLVDASFLWEMYIYNLMKIHLHDWEVDAQEELHFYEQTFYAKDNYPDFVLRHRLTGEIVVLDAKFKNMEFNGRDVDNADIRQLHGYSYYYHLQYGDKFRGAGLIYPAKERIPQNKVNVDFMYGIDGLVQKFGVFTIKDPSGDETIIGNEEYFIEELKLFIGDES